MQTTQTTNEVQILKQKLSKIYQEYETILKQISNSQQQDEIKFTLSHLNEMINKAASNEFHIGVIGPFNVGKSTFLNALLKRQLVSTNILPETASLTLLKELPEGQTEEKAKVTFFSTEEWNKKKKQVVYETSLKDQVQKLEEIEKNTTDFKDWIQSTNKSIQCGLSELSNYTAATIKDNKAIFVKEVEVLINSPFTKDQIVLIDTPGLDDPDQIRSLITENKMKSLDLLIMLFPSQQVFTKGDKDFIKKQMYHHNMHRTFFIINKIDQLNDPEDEVPVIKKFLSDQVSALYDEVLKEKPDIQIKKSEIEIFPVSSYQAFLHYTRPDKARWTLEETNMMSFEERLKKFLFEGEKAKELIHKLKVNREGLLKHRLIQVQDHIDILDQGIEVALKKIEDLQKDRDSLIKGFEKSKAYIEKRSEQFERQFHQKLEFLKSDIKRFDMLLQSTANSLFERFLGHHSGESAADHISSWVQSDFSSGLLKTLKQETENRIANFNQEIQMIWQSELEQINDHYQELQLNVEDISHFNIENPDVDIDDFDHEESFGFVSFIGDLLKTVLGPIGSFIVDTLSSLFGGLFGSSDKDARIEVEIRRKFNTQIPNIVRNILHKTEELLIKEISKNKDFYIKHLHEKIQIPINSEKEKLDQKEASLKKIMDDLNQDQAQKDRIKQELTIEKLFLANQLTK